MGICGSSSFTPREDIVGQNKESLTFLENIYASKSAPKLSELSKLSALSKLSVRALRILKALGALKALRALKAFKALRGQSWLSSVQRNTAQLSSAQVS